MTTKTNDQIVSPVKTADLAAWLGVAITDPLLPDLLTAATDSVRNYLGGDLLRRAWTLTEWDWPGEGKALASEIYLPKLLSVTSVKVGGIVTTKYVQRAASLMFPSPLRGSKDKTAPDLEIVYFAGYGLTHDTVPPVIRQAIKILAAYSYEQRGCNEQTVITDSGVASMLTPLREQVVVFA